MTVFKCKMCGATLEIKENQSLVTCEYCGTRQTLTEFDDSPRAKQSSADQCRPFLERAFLFLEDGKWQDANNYCEKALDVDPKNAEAYLGKLMAELRVRKQEELADCKKPFDSSTNYQKAVRFGGDTVGKTLTEYNDTVNKRLNKKSRSTGDAAKKRKRIIVIAAATAVVVCAAISILLIAPFGQNVSVDNSTVEHLEENAAFAIADNDGNYYLITATGKVTKQIEALEAKEHILVQDIVIQQPEIGEQICVNGSAADTQSQLNALLLLLREIEAAELERKITSVSVPSATNLKAWYEDRFEVLLGTTDELAFKLEYLKVVIQEDFTSGIIDLTFIKGQEAYVYPNDY